MPLHRRGSAFGVSNSAVLQNCLDLEQNPTFFKDLNNPRLFKYEQISYVERVCLSTKNRPSTAVCVIPRLIPFKAENSLGPNSPLQLLEKKNAVQCACLHLLPFGGCVRVLANPVGILKKKDQENSHKKAYHGGEQDVHL